MFTRLLKLSCFGLLACALASPALPQGNGKAKGHNKEDGDGGEGHGKKKGKHEFGPRDRDVISSYYADSNLPPGLAKRGGNLPPGLEKQLQRNGTLPPGLQKRVQPLPGSCEAQLPRLPRDWARVVLSGRIILLDPQQRIVDLFWLERD